MLILVNNILHRDLPSRKKIICNVHPARSLNGFCVNLTGNCHLPCHLCNFRKTSNPVTLFKAELQGLYCCVWLVSLPLNFSVCVCGIVVGGVGACVCDSFIYLIHPFIIGVCEISDNEDSDVCCKVYRNFIDCCICWWEEYLKRAYTLQCSIFLNHLARVIFFKMLIIDKL